MRIFCVHYSPLSRCTRPHRMLKLILNFCSQTAYLDFRSQNKKEPQMPAMCLHSNQHQLPWYCLVYCIEIVTFLDSWMQALCLVNLCDTGHRLGCPFYMPRKSNQM